MTSPSLRTAIEALPPLRETLRQHGLFTKKSLGQHFLFDLNLTDKIAAAAGEISARHVLEIGPGPGGLTRSILKRSPRLLTVIERDADCVPIMEELLGLAGDQMQLVQGDALAVDYATLPTPQDMTIIANLPYNVGTELLFLWLETPEYFQQMVLMFQKEVAQRVTAQPGDNHYGRVAVMAQWRYEAEMLFDIPAGAFFPPPKVTSSVIRLRRRAEPLAQADKSTLEKIVKAAFTQRRKMLRVSLKQLSPKPEAWLEEAGITPTLRPEELTIQQFCALARCNPHQ